MSSLILLNQQQNNFVLFANADICTVATGKKDVLFEHNTFNASSPINKVWTEISGNALRLAKDEVNGGTWGLAWHTVKQRIADGFVSTFKVKIKSTSQSARMGDGFAYVIQNDKIEDLNGGSGDNLGCSGIAKSIAIKFDICSDRPTCSNQRISVEQNDVVLLPAFAPTVNLKDGNEHTVVITYEGYNKGAAAQLSISIDSGTATSVTVGDLSANLFQSRYAYFGFAASTSWDETAQIDITQWKVEIQPSDSIISEREKEKPDVRKADYGQNVTYLLVLRDTCQTPLTATPSGKTVVAKLQLQQPANTDPRDYVILSPLETVTFLNGSYMFIFHLPNNTVGVWDLSVTVDGVPASNMPWVGAAQSVVPIPPVNGLPVWALVLLLLFVLLIVIVMSYLLYRLWRYRQKLKENEEFIEAGKVQAKLNALEDGTTYAVNPMMGTLDDLKEQLRKNEEELAKLRARGVGGVDQEHLLDQLQKQRDGLLTEMNELKKRQQEKEIENMDGSKVTAKPKGRKQFGQAAGV